MKQNRVPVLVILLNPHTANWYQLGKLVEYQASNLDEDIVQN